MSSVPPTWGSGHFTGLEYHQRMLNDPFRMDAYERALRALIRPGDVVLDAGAGTGILSLLAARRGARKVYAVESTPVAQLAKALVQANALQAQVEVIEADLRTLDPLEPVDLVVSDFMGRLVVDDGMLEAMQAAARWLKPDGRFCPEALTLCLAPADLTYFAPLDGWEGPLAGLSLEPARSLALRDDFGVSLPLEALLSAPQPFAQLNPRHPTPPKSTSLDFTLTRDGRLRALVGFFEARMAPQVFLSTAPGHATHWGQALLPLPVTHVQPGDRLSVHLSLVPHASTYRWRWHGTLCRGNTLLTRFDLTNDGLDQAPSCLEPARPAPRSTLSEAHARGALAFSEGRYGDAVEAFEEVVERLGPEADDVAGELWENLGIVYSYASRPQRAIPAFLRALDGQPARREQSARLLINALLALGWSADASRYLEAYHQAFGPHPDLG